MINVCEGSQRLCFSKMLHYFLHEPPMIILKIIEWTHSFLFGGFYFKKEFLFLNISRAGNVQIADVVCFNFDTQLKLGRDL